MSLEDKHFQHVAKMKALVDRDNWTSWDSPIGLTIFFVGGVMSLIGLAVFGILIKFLFLMK